MCMRIYRSTESFDLSSDIVFVLNSWRLSKDYPIINHRCNEVTKPIEGCLETFIFRIYIYISIVHSALWSVARLTIES